MFQCEVSLSQFQLLKFGLNNIVKYTAKQVENKYDQGNTAPFKQYS